MMKGGLDMEEGWEAEMYVKKKKMKLRENGRRERKVKLGMCCQMRQVSWFKQVGFDQQVGQLDDELANGDYELSKDILVTMGGVM